MYEKFNNILINNEFKVNSSYTYVYSKLFKVDCTIICLYIYDMLIFGTNIESINNAKLFLSSHFEMKDLREADIILGVKIRKTKLSISLHQKHIKEI